MRSPDSPADAHDAGELGQCRVGPMRSPNSPADAQDAGELGQCGPLIAQLMLMMLASWANAVP